MQVTGTATTNDARAYAASGFTGTLGKPFTVDALRAVISAHVPAAAGAASAQSGRHAQGGGGAAVVAVAAEGR